MAIVQIDLERGYISCLACGKGTYEGALESPCPHCGCRFDQVEYKRDRVRQRTKQLFGRTRFTLFDMELEKINACEFVWDKVERPKWLLQTNDEDTIYEAKKKWFKLRGINLPAERKVVPTT